MTDKQKELLAKFNRVSEDKSQLQEFTRAIIMNEIGGDNIIPDNGSFYWPSDKQPLWDIQIGEKDYRLFDPISDNYYFTQPFFRIPTDECYLVDLAYYFDYLGEWGNLPNASYQYNGQNLIFTRDSDLEDAFWGLYDINPSAFEELTGLTNIAEDDSVLIALTSLYMSSDPDTNGQVLKRIILLIHYSGNALNEIREMEDPDSSDTPYDLVVIDDNRTTPPFWTKLDISESKTYRVLNAYKSEHQIEQQISNRNSLITIVNWDKYQITEQQIEQQVNSNRTTSEQQVNTNKNIKNIKNEIIYNNIVKIFNEKCLNLSKIKKVTDKRKKAIDKFLKEYTQEQFEEICTKANESNFLTGKNDRGWKADFDFILRIDKATSILEGKYDNTKSNKVTNYNNYKQREYDNLNYIYANRR